jgi:hypothetical protein
LDNKEFMKERSTYVSFLVFQQDKNLQQDNNLTPLTLARTTNCRKLLPPSSMIIQTLIAENIHPREKTIHKDPSTRLAHE